MPAVHAGEAAALPAGRRGPADRRHRDADVDVRLVAATHRDLEAEVGAGPLPPGLLLPHQRRRDPDPAAARAPRRHPALADFFLRRYSARLGGRSRVHPRRDGAAAGASVAGQRARTRERDRARGEPRLGPAAYGRGPAGVGDAAGPDGRAAARSPADERDRLVQALEQSRWNQSRAAASWGSAARRCGARCASTASMPIQSRRARPRETICCNALLHETAAAPTAWRFSAARLANRPRNAPCSRRGHTRCHAGAFGCPVSRLPSAVAAFLLLVGGVPQAAAPPAADAPSLTALFDRTSGLVRDTNGDGIADVVAAADLVPAAPSSRGRGGCHQYRRPSRIRDERADAAAGARATSDAMPAEAAPDPARPANARSCRPLVATSPLDLSRCKPGQGLIAAVVPARDRRASSSRRRRRGDAGRRQRACGRLPRLWNMSGSRCRGRGPGRRLPARARRRRRRAAGVGLVVGQRQARPRGRPRAVAPADAAQRRGAAPSPTSTRRIGAVWSRDAQLRRGGGVASTTAAAAPAIVQRAGLNQRTLTPPIDPDELAPDSPGERGRAGRRRRRRRAGRPST